MTSESDLAIPHTDYETEPPESPSDEPLLFSVDVETTGPTPAVGELISIGAVALGGSIRKGTLWVPPYDSSWTWQANLTRVNGRHESGTMKWWENFPAQMAQTFEHHIHPFSAMTMFEQWVDSFNRKAIFVAWPAAFDWQFINSAFWQYRGRNPFGYSPFCLKNYALGALKRFESVLSSRSDAELPEGWLITPEDIGLTSHLALDDAVAQAHMLVRILKETRQVTH